MKPLILILVFSCSFLTTAQTITVKAESGDGIFSILRKQGLDPVKYYADFVHLNLNNLKNGSELYLDREYVIPDAPDSFKKMALSISEGIDKESPIFDKELGSISPKSERLKNAVIYLLSGQNGVRGSRELQFVRNQIVRSVAQKLIVHGAKVYLIDELKDDDILSSPSVIKDGDTTENAIADQNQMQHYVEIINKRYLKNMGKYQRIVVINLNNTVKDSKHFEVSIFHHGKSTEGERFAKSLQHIFNKNSIENEQKNFTEVFANSSNLYLVTNVLPPVTMIDIGDSRNPSIEERISISSQENVLTNIITNGVLTDYANLSIEDN